MEPTGSAMLSETWRMQRGEDPSDPMLTTSAINARNPRDRCPAFVEVRNRALGVQYKSTE